MQNRLGHEELMERVRIVREEVTAAAEANSDARRRASVLIARVRVRRRDRWQRRFEDALERHDQALRTFDPFER